MRSTWAPSSTSARRQWWCAYLRDEFTTLKDTDDRIFATAVTAAWSYNDTPDDWRAIRGRVRETLIREFAARFSPSVQATLFEMDSTPDLEAAKSEYMKLAATLWQGGREYSATPLKDREIFDLLGYD